MPATPSAPIPGRTRIFTYKKMTEPQVREEIEKGFSAVKMAIVVLPCCSSAFRGRHTQPALGYLASRNISMFSVYVHFNHFKSSGPDEVSRTSWPSSTSRARASSWTHDLQKHTAIALPTLLRRLQAGGDKVVQMKAKEQLEALPEYDAMLVKDQKTPAVASRPISSVVQTVSQ